MRQKGKSTKNPFVAEAENLRSVVKLADPDMRAKHVSLAVARAFGKREMVVACWRF